MPRRSPPRGSRPSPRRCALLLTSILAIAGAAAAEELQPATAASTEEASLFRFLSRMPELISQNLPMFQPGGAYWIYARPRFGNPLQGGFFRLDLGAWFKATDHLSLNAGSQSYVWRDASEHDATRRGFYGVSSGVKYETSLSSPAGSAMSAGLNYSTPVSRPPLVLVDGFRHTDPYVSYSRPLNPKNRLVGFATFGADLLNRTPLPANFGVNELHSNSLGLSVGASRPWRHFSASLTLNSATTELLSKHGQQVFGLVPQIFVPLFPGRIRFARVTLVLSGKAITGPDGRQFGSGLSVHWDLRSRPYEEPQ